MPEKLSRKKTNDNTKTTNFVVFFKIILLFYLLSSIGRHNILYFIFYPQEKPDKAFPVLYECLLQVLHNLKHYPLQEFHS